MNKLFFRTRGPSELSNKVPNSPFITVKRMHYFSYFFEDQGVVRTIGHESQHPSYYLFERVQFSLNWNMHYFKGDEKPYFFGDLDPNSSIELGALQ